MKKKNEYVSQIGLSYRKIVSNFIPLTAVCLSTDTDRVYWYDVRLEHSNETLLHKKKKISFQGLQHLHEYVESAKQPKCTQTVDYYE